MRTRRAPGMLMIGASGRKLGKTELAAGLIRRFASSGPVGVKVTPIDPGRGCPSGGEGCGVCEALDGPFDLSEERDPDPAKDTGRLLLAGARRVLWLRVRCEALAEGAAALLDALGPAGLSICESSSLRRVLAPDLLLLVRGPDDAAWKESARAARSEADRLVRLGDGGFDFDVGEIALEAGRWVMPPRAAGLVLAGGESRRMGRDKALVELEGQPLIGRVVGQLGGLVAPILISANHPGRYAFLGLPVVADRAAGQGPLMGIASALAASPAERNLVMACDMPRLDRALARALVAGLDAADVALPIDPAGRPEPLFAAYRRSAAPALFAALAAGRRRIVEAFAGLRVLRLPLGPHDRLVNLNTAEELRAFEERGGC